MQDRKSIDQIVNLPISPSLSTTSGTAGSSNYVLLRQVAQPITVMGPNEILRQNNQRYIGITATTQGRAQSQIMADVQKALAAYHFPPGYYWQWGLSQQQQRQEVSGPGLSVVMAIALIYMLLASQCESFVYPLTILCSVPLAGIGVALGLFLTGRAFGLTAFIGLLLQIGIVVKNGILLIDYTN